MIMRLWLAAAIIIFVWLLFSATALVEQSRQEMSGVKARPPVSVSASREAVTISWFDGKMQIARPEMPEWEEVQQAFKNALDFWPYKTH